MYFNLNYRENFKLITGQQ